MFIKNALNIKNSILRYALGIFVIFIFTQIGAIPFIVAIFNKVGVEGAAKLDPSNMMTILENSNLTFFYTLLSFFVGFIGFLFVIKFLHNQSFLSVTTSRKSIDYKRILTSFSAISTFIILSTTISFFTSPEEYILQFNLNDFLILVLIAIIFIPIQTSLEEFIFRGYLMEGFASLLKNSWMPLIFTSLIFGLLHIYNPEVDKLGHGILVYYIGTGLFLGVLSIMDQGIELSIGFHAANNLVTALLVTSTWTVFQTESILIDVSEPSLFFETVFSLLILYPLFLYFMSRKYNWNNWKEKIF